MGWFENTSNAIYDALCATFGLDPSTQVALKRFVPAYVGGVTTPQAKSDADVCYFSVSERQGTNSDYISVKRKSNQLEITKTIPATVLLTFYGPNSDDDAEYFWSNFMIDTGASGPRAILRNANIVPDGKPERPLSVPELEGTLWRRRCDVRVNLSYLDVQTKNVSTVSEAPEVTISAVVTAEEG